MSPAAGKRMVNHVSHVESRFSVLLAWLCMCLLFCPCMVFLWPGIGVSASGGGVHAPAKKVRVQGPAGGVQVPVDKVPGPAYGSPASSRGIPASTLEIIQVKHLFDIMKDAVFPALDQPSAVAVDSQKRIWVLDGVNSRLVGFSYDGKYVTQFGKRGSGPGEFGSPLGLSIDSHDLIYVADSKNHRVQIFDDRASPVADIYVPPDKYRSLSDPTDMALDEGKQQLVVVDNDNHRLVIFKKKSEAVHPTYTLASDVGGVGYEDGKFRYPYALCLDKSGNIYVTDVINTRVQILSAKGEYIRSIGEWGIEKGQFFRPQSICMDQKGRVFVGENYAKIGLVQVFDQEGNFLGVVGDSSNRKVRFQVPADLFIDQQNRLYVVQMYTSTISVYSLGK
jgi:sugar lactone lactonase YvrE